MGKQPLSSNHSSTKRNRLAPATRGQVQRERPVRRAAPIPEAEPEPSPGASAEPEAVKCVVPLGPPRMVRTPRQTAHDSGLRYVDDGAPGIRRERLGPKSFRYLAPSGREVADPATLGRIARLGIPPAWEDVWICPHPKGHLQATGRDARGRKQYRYHPWWREARDETKFDRIIQFGLLLPCIRDSLEADLARPGLPRENVLAALVKLLETTLIRVGNEEYAQQNQSFGLTTMRDGHARVRGGRVMFEFRAKSGKDWKIDLSDRRLARIVKQCQELPGQHLFAYHDERGRVRRIRSEDVNAYLKSICGREFTAKDFRTWTGTVLAAMALREMEQVDTQARAKKNVVAAIETVARKLGNTPAICRKCYVHPIVLESYLEGSLLGTLSHAAEQAKPAAQAHWSAEENAVLEFLQRRLGAERDGRAAAEDDLTAKLIPKPKVAQKPKAAQDPKRIRS